VQFQESKPESQIPGPNQINVPKMATLRRRQLLHLADAYGIEHPLDATKDQMVPLMMAAESNGAFEREPVDRRKLAQAMELPPEQWPPMEDSHELSHRELQQMCKERGINSYGKSTDELKEALGL